MSETTTHRGTSGRATSSEGALVRRRSQRMALGAGVLLLVGSWAWTAPASADVAGSYQAPAAGAQSTAAASPTPPSVAGVASPAAGSVAKGPDGPPNGCTVEVNGEKIHGTYTYGSSWCCHTNAAGNEECFNCDSFTCRSGWTFTGPGGATIPQFVEP